MFAVLAYDSFKIKIRQYVTVEYHGGFAYQIFGKFVGAGGAHWLRLDFVLELHAIIGAIAEKLFDLVWLIRKRKRDVCNCRGSGRIGLIKQKKTISNWHNWFWGVNG